MPQKPVPENSTSAQPEKAGYDVVMMFYLVSGVLGCLYYAFLFVYVWLLDQEFLPAESLGYFLVFGFPGVIIGFLVTYGWLLGIFLLIRYCRSWRVVVPAAALVAVGVFSFISRVLLLLSSINDVALVFYFFVATLVGIEWLLSKTLHSRNRPPAA